VLTDGAQGENGMNGHRRKVGLVSRREAISERPFFFGKPMCEKWGEIYKGVDTQRGFPKQTSQGGLRMLISKRSFEKVDKRMGFA